MKKNMTGFTLIELMIVVAIIAILAGIAIPQFANLVAKSQEAVTKGNLGVLRSALSIYYGDNEGAYPNTVGMGSGGFPGVMTPRYLNAIPNAYFPTTPNNVGHSTSNNVANFHGSGGLMIPTWLAGGGVEFGDWQYDSTSADPNWGMVMPSCTHSDLKGQPWYDN